MIRKRFGFGAFLASLFNPCLIFVDHGHFQYNAVSLGLSLIALYYATSERKRDRIIGCFWFTLAIMYKQMELYHSFAFFFLLIGFALRNPTKYGKLAELAAYGLAVVITTVAVLSPFLLYSDDPKKQIGQILFRLFPFGRGLFEDKVANIWCTLHTVLKIRNRLDHASQLKLATCCTLLFSIIPCLKLLKCQKPASMVNALAASSLAFFLFSFQGMN